ncbi:MAG: asparagine synthase (glutamine-hydrolyzing) [Magnetospirillum sp. WYHS-4]
MCGIAGILAAPGATPSGAVLDRLQDALRHRGPDGSGRHVEGRVGLVQTRLAIIDLEGGRQPLHAGGATLVANGEVYNYLELRDGMKDCLFATHSDCEPPLHLYLGEGPAFTKRLRGMYAIALHDPAHDRLLLARDPFGIKPLYVAETPAGLAFASEAQALVAAGLVAPVVNRTARDQLLQLQFACGRQTLFEGIRRVLPGETLVLEDGFAARQEQRSPLPDGGPVPISEGAALMELDRRLNDTVGIHQRSDVPYGMFLSGGIDSSVLLAMMTRLNERPVQALTAGFPGTAARDERDHARAVAKAAGADHHEVEFTADDFWRLLPEVAATLDDPVADYAILPTYKLAAAARAAGLKVVLSGEGGDELFAGYSRYRRAARWRLLGGRPMRAKGILEGLGVLRHEDRAWRDPIAAVEAEAQRGGRSRLQAQQAVDVADWLPNDLLLKLDRCLMAHGVEGRVPFLDPILADFAVRLPDSLKVKRGLGKWLLRRWLETALPAARPFERKRGFTVPVGDWIAARGRTLGPLVAAQPGIAEACRREAVERLFASADPKAGKAAWTLLFYALWHQRHILGRRLAPDAMEALAG